MKFFKYINTIPESPTIDGNPASFGPGDIIAVRKGSAGVYRWETHKVAADGEIYSASLTEDEWTRLDQLQQADIDKLKTDYTKAEIDDRIKQVNGELIPVIGTVLPQGASVPSWVVTNGKAELIGGTGGTTFTQSGGASTTVSEGFLRMGYYDKSTDLWTFDTIEKPLPSIDTSAFLEKDELFKTQSNLLDSATRKDGFFISNAGVETANATFSYFTIPLNLKLIYIEGDFTAVTSYGAYFDASGNFLRAFIASGQTLINTPKNKIASIVPEGAVTLKLNVITSLISTYKVYDALYKRDEGTVIKDQYLPNVVTTDSSLFVSNILANSDFYKFFDYGYTRVRTEVLELYANVTISMIGLIPVKEGDVVKVTDWLDTLTPSGLSTRGQYFDSTGKYLAELPVIDSLSPEYPVISGASYITLLYEKSKANDISVEILSSSGSSLKISRNSIFPAIPDIVNTWQGKKWVSQGDSITFRNIWQPYVIASLGLNHVNLGIGSTCMINAGPTPMSSDDRIDAIIAENPDVVTLLAGANDLVYIEGAVNTGNIVPGAGIGDKTEFDKSLASKNKLLFYGAYSYVIERLLTWKPTLRIFILGTTWAHNGGSAVNTLHTYKEFADASKEIAIHYGLTYVDTYANVGFNKFTMGNAPNNVYSLDRIHPNDAGGRRMATIVIDSFNSNKPI